MSEGQRLPQLIFVVGPTACGKSDLAVEAAETFAARGRYAPELINCDSVQFFDGVEIGAAKPGPELLKRAVHHLVGHVPLGGEYTAGDFRRDALSVIRSRSAAGLEGLFAVGGSGFYVQALEKGMYDVPEIGPGVREGLESAVEEKGLKSLHDELRVRDPATAAKINVADQYRILRALEILRSSPDGETLEAIRARFEAGREPQPFRASKIGLFRPREILRKRVAERTKAMLQAGLIDEVEGLRKRGLTDWAPLSSVGYRETQDYLEGRLKREDLEGAIVTSTMQLAKRQMTWFKRDPSIRWFDTEQGLAAPVAHALTLLET